MNKPKILVFDIETAPMLGYVWGLFDNNVSLDQLKKDWHLLSWAAKWLDDPPSKIMYADQRNARDLENDKGLCKQIWKLLDEADILVTQNGKAFDQKKLNARFAYWDMRPPSPSKHFDLKLIAKKHFAFSSYKLEYMAKHLNKKYKKLKSHKFPGFTMWLECLAGNQKAWKEMEKYNKLDVLSLEETYKKLIPWDSPGTTRLFRADGVDECLACGSRDFIKNGYIYTATGRFQKYNCTSCGAHVRGRTNLARNIKTMKVKVVS